MMKRMTKKKKKKRNSELDSSNRRVIGKPASDSEVDDLHEDFRRRMYLVDVKA